MLNIGIYLNFTVAMIAKMADKIAYNREIARFLTKFKVFRDFFFSKLDISTAKYQINPFHTLCAMIIFISFWYLIVLFFNFSVKRLKFAPKWSLSYFQPILAAIFVTIATAKVIVISDLYTWVIVLIY